MTTPSGGLRLDVIYSWCVRRAADSHRYDNRCYTMTLDIQCPATYPDGWELLIVGEAPGSHELETHEGFTGPAGNVLDKIVFAGGISPSRIAKTNVVKEVPDCGCKHHIREHEAKKQLNNRGQYETRWVCQSQGCGCKAYNGFDSDHFKATFYETSVVGRKKVVQPSPRLKEWIENLRLELVAANPNVVVAAGTEALSALCGIDGITKFRGSILPSTLVPGLWVVPIVHPAAILRSAQWQELYISGEIIRRKVLPIVRSGKFEYTPWEETLTPDIGQALTFLERINGPFTLDIETTGGSVACIGLCYFDNNVDRAICVPIQTQFGPWFSPENEWAFWRGLYGVSRKHKVIGHNLGYDLDWLCRYGIDPVDFDDTMVMFHRCYPELPKGLAFVNMWFNDIPYYKDDGKEAGYRTQGEALYKYNIKDVVSDHRIWRELNKYRSLPKFQRALKMYDTYSKPCFPIAFEMQILGMDATPEGVAYAQSILTEELAKIRHTLDRLSGGALVLREGNKKITDQQVKAYLYDTLKLPAKHNRKTKSVTADEDALVELLIQHPDLEVLKAINAERKFLKAITSYTDISWSEP